MIKKGDNVMNFGIEVSRDDIIDMVVIWNESATFRVFTLDFAEEIDVFTAYDVMNIEQAQHHAKGYLSRVYDEMYGLDLEEMYGS